MNLTLDAIPRKLVYVVKQTDAAMRLVRKLSGPHKPGDIIPLAQDEYEALKEDCMALEIPE